MIVVRASAAHLAAWIDMRRALWPDEDADLLAAQAREWLDDPEAGQHAWFALAGDALLGFAEATLRHDYVNGCDTSPVAFLEGLYVAPQHRRRGVARALVDAVAAWAVTQDVSEFASDALIENRASHAMHQALGFAETERVVYFRRPLA